MDKEMTETSVEKVVSLLKVIKYCSQYERLEKSASQEIMNEAWPQLNVERQQEIIEMIENNIQPTAKTIAEEMLLCQSKEELTTLKEEFGAELSKEAWMLLNNDQKVQIQEMCASLPKPPKPPKPEPKPEPEPEKPQTSSLFPAFSPAEREVSIEVELIEAELSSMATNQPKPIESKGKGLIELSEEEEELKEIINSILEDTEGRIPPDLATAFDELLARQVENEKQLKVKIDNYCAVMKHHSDWAEIRFKESERLHELAEKDLAVAKVLEVKLKNYLETSGKMKIKTKRFNPRICKNGGKTPIKLNVPVEDLPPNYKVKKELVSADLETLREILESGEELSFASLGERGTHLRFK